MTVKELIDTLAKCEPTATVCFSDMGEGGPVVVTNVVENMVQEEPVRKVLSYELESIWL